MKKLVIGVVKLVVDLMAFVSKCTVLIVDEGNR